MLATGEMHSVREFVEKAFKHLGITIGWQNATGTVDEIGVDAANPSRVLVKVLDLNRSNELLCLREFFFFFFVCLGAHFLRFAWCVKLRVL